jgi:hypothetical protein
MRSRSNKYPCHLSACDHFFKGLVAGCHSFCLFFIFFYNIHTFIHSITFIQNIYPSPFAGASLHLLIAWKLSGKTCPVTIFASKQAGFPSTNRVSSNEQGFLFSLLSKNFPLFLFPPEINDCSQTWVPSLSLSLLLLSSPSPSPHPSLTLFTHPVILLATSLPAIPTYLQVEYSSFIV